MEQNRSAYSDALREMLPAARAAVDALKDAGRSATACTLESKLFTLDALDQEMERQIRDGPDAFMAAVELTLRTFRG